MKLAKGRKYIPRNVQIIANRELFQKNDKNKKTLFNDDQFLIILTKKLLDIRRFRG